MPEQNSEAYHINPFQPVRQIVGQLKDVPSEYKAAMQLSRSVALSVQQNSPEAMLRLALAYYLWRERKLDGNTMAEMVEVMKALGTRHRFDDTT